MLVRMAGKVVRGTASPTCADCYRVAPCFRRSQRFLAYANALPQEHGSATRAGRNVTVQFKLQRAYLQGKRHVNIQGLSKEVGMDRKEVLDWFKAFDALPESEREATLASARRRMEEDDRRRKAREEGRSSARFVPDGAEPRDNRWPAARSARFVPDGAEAREERRSAARFVSDGAEAHDQRWPAARFSTDGAGTDVPRRGAPTRTSAQGGGPADWARTPANKRLSQEALATLEKVYESNKYPSDDILRSLWDLYRLPRRRLVDWFSERRKREGRRGAY